MKDIKEKIKRCRERGEMRERKRDIEKKRKKKWEVRKEIGGKEDKVG